MIMVSQDHTGDTGQEIQDNERTRSQIIQWHMGVRNLEQQRQRQNLWNNVLTGGIKNMVKIF